jgi:hypothetical protein
MAFLRVPTDSVLAILTGDAGVIAREETVEFEDRD